MLRPDLPAVPLESVACNLCGQDETRVIADVDRYGFPTRVVECRHCGLQYLNPRMSADGYAAFYADVYRSLIAWHIQRPYPLSEIEADQQRYAEKLADAVATEMPHGGTLLDLGGSTGIVAQTFRRRFGLAPTVVDPSAAELARAVDCTTVCARAEQVTFPASSFDVIVCARTVDHLLDPVGVLTRARRWLRPGGRLVVDAMNVEAWVSFARYKVDHPYAFTEATLRELVEAAGWHVERRWTRRHGHYIGFICTGAVDMGRTSKARTEAYDNIQTGGGAGIVTTRERTIPDQTGVKAGALPPAFTTWGNTENIAVGTDYSADENLVVSGTNLLAIERLG